MNNIFQSKLNGEVFNKGISPNIPENIFQKPIEKGFISVLPYTTKIKKLFLGFGSGPADKPKFAAQTHSAEDTVGSNQTFVGFIG